jgi:hypothetical protein
MRRLISGHVVAAPMLAMWPGPARADAVAGAAASRPYVDGSWIVGLFLTALGVSLLRSGMRYRWTADAMSAWPVVDGKVIENHVDTRVDDGGEEPDVTRFIPRVRYVYTTDGATREGATIRIGLADLGYTSARRAREHAGRYPTGARIAVRYDPANPTMAVLEAGQIGGVKKIVSGAILLAVGLAVFVFVVSTGGPEGR